MLPKANNVVVFRNEYHDRHFHRRSRREDMHIPFAVERRFPVAYMHLSIAASLAIIALVALLNIS